MLTALGSLALAAAQPATAQTPCWRQVINDWADNHHIDGTYSQQCYREAIANVPADLLAYTSILDDIVAASRQVLRTTQVHTGSKAPLASKPTTPKKTATRSAPSRSLFTVAFDKLGPRNADSFPLPLLILAGLSLLLIGGGAAGLLSRRLRARRAPSPAP